MTIATATRDFNPSLRLLDVQGAKAKVYSSNQRIILNPSEYRDLPANFPAAVYLPRGFQLIREQLFQLVYYGKVSQSDLVTE